MQQPVLAAASREVEVDASVIVVVARDDRLHETDRLGSRRFRNFTEGAVALVQVELARVRQLAVLRLVPDEKIEPAVVVEVGEGGRLRGVLAVDAGRNRDVLEGAVAAIAQQRVGDASLLGEPSAAQHEDIGMAVVVVVGVEQVEPADLAVEPRFVHPLGEGPVPVVVVEPHPVAQPERRAEDVDEAVAVEVLGDGATGERDRIDATRMGDVGKAADVGVRRECRRRDQPLLRHLLRPRPERHVDEIQAPARIEVTRIELEQLHQRPFGILRATPEQVDAAAPDRQHAGITAVVSEAVLELAHALPRDRADAECEPPHLVRAAVATRVGQPVELVEDGECLLHLVVLDQGVREDEPQVGFACRSDHPLEPFLELGDVQRGQEVVLHRVGARGDLLEPLRHLLRRRCARIGCAWVIGGRWNGVLQ